MQFPDSVLTEEEIKKRQGRQATPESVKQYGYDNFRKAVGEDTHKVFWENVPEYRELYGDQQKQYEPVNYSRSMMPEQVENQAQQQSGLFRRLAVDPLISAAKGVVGLGESLVGLADIPTGGAVGKFMQDSVNYDPMQTRQFLDEYYTPEQQRANQAVQQADGFFDTAKTAIKNPSTIAHTVIESAPSMLGAFGIREKLITSFPKLAPILAAGIGEGAISAGSAAENIRQSNESRDLTAKQSAIATTSGILTGLITVGAGKLAQRLGIDDVDMLGSPDVPDTAKKNIFRRLAESAISEGLIEELPQSAQEQIAHNIATGKPKMEGVANAAAMGMFAGMAMGVGGVAGKSLLDRGTEEHGDTSETQLNGSGTSTLPIAEPTSDTPQPTTERDQRISEASPAERILLNNDEIERGVTPEDILTGNDEVKASSEFTDEELDAIINQASANTPTQPTTPIEPTAPTVEPTMVEPTQITPAQPITPQPPPATPTQISEPQLPPQTPPSVELDASGTSNLPTVEPTVVEPTTNEVSAPLSEPLTQAEYTKGIKGKSDKAYLNDNTPIDFDYEILEHDQLVPSHDDQLRKNSNYPQEIQPRERETQRYMGQITDIANNLNPERLGADTSVANGSPIIAKNSNVVESGNGRTIALGKAYKSDKGKGESYKQWLTANAGQFGLDADAIKNMDKPVLVRRRTTDMTNDQLKDFVSKANQSSVAKLSPSEQGKIDAESITSEDLNLFRPDEAGNLGAKSNRAFLNSFIQKIGSSESSGYFTDKNEPNKDLIDRVQNAIFQKAYNSDVLLKQISEEADPDMRNVLNALNVAAGDFAKAKSLKGFDQTGIDITDRLVESFKVIQDARNNYQGTLSQQVNQELSQQKAFEKPIPSVTKDIVKTIADNYRSGKRTALFFKHLAEGARSYVADINQQTLIGEPVIKNSRYLVNEAKKRLELLNSKNQEIDFNAKTTTDTEGALEHEQAVKKALENGDITPEEAEALGHFKQFPDLQEKYGKKAEEKTPATPAVSGGVMFSNPANQEKQQAMLQDIEKGKNYNFKHKEGDKVWVTDNNGESQPYIVKNYYIENGKARYAVYPSGKKSEIVSVAENNLKPREISNIPIAKRDVLSKQQTPFITKAEAVKAIRDAGKTKTHEPVKIKDGEDDAWVGRVKGKKPAPDAKYSVKPDTDTKIIATLTGDEIQGNDGKERLRSAREYYKNKLPENVEREGLGIVRISGKGWEKTKQGVPIDIIKAKLIPAIPDIIKYGEISDRQPVENRIKDKFIAFYHITGYVKIGDITYQAGVTIGEDSFGNTYYNINHDTDKLFEKKKARLLPRNIAVGDEPSLENQKFSNSTLISDSDGVNLFYKKIESAKSFTPASLDELKPIQRKIADTLIRKGTVQILTNEQAMEMLKGKEGLYSTAWHGSPHDHDGFDMSKIGTGEGAQVYGYGLYFAESKKIAEWYRYVLSPVKVKVKSATINGKNFDINSVKDNMVKEDLQYVLTEAIQWAIDIQANLDSSMQGIIDYTTEQINNGEGDIKVLQDRIKEAQFLKDNLKIKLKKEPSGVLYKVDIAPTEKEMLYLDGDFHSQSDKIRKLLAKDWGDSSRTTGLQVYKNLTKKLGSDKLASEYLLSLGIRGNKYLDGTSRGKGKGNYNYVIFNDKDITIEAKYSQDGRIQGFVLNGKAHIIPENIEQGKMWDVVKHEVGVHIGQMLQNDAEFNQLKNEIAERREEQSPTGDAIRKAYARAEAAKTKPENMTEEVLGYIVESAPHTTIARKIIALVKKYLRKMGIYVKFSDKDIAALADIAVRREAYRKDGGKGVEPKVKKTSFSILLNMPFKEQLQKFLKNQSTEDLIGVSDTPEILLALGAEQLPITVTSKVLRKVSFGKHQGNLSITDLEKLPEKLKDPIAVFESKTQAGSLVLMLEMVDNKNNTVVVPVFLNQENRRHIVNSIGSIYGKDNDQWFKQQIEQDRLKYVNTKKIREWHVIRGLQLPKMRGAIHDFGNNILTEEHFVKQKEQLKTDIRYSIAPRSSDAGYESNTFKDVLPDKVAKQTQLNRGVNKRTLLDKIKEAASTIIQERYHFPDLMRDGATVERSVNKEILRRQQDVGQVAQDKAKRKITNFIRGLDKAGMDMYALNIILADEVRMVKDGLREDGKLPNGFETTQEILDSYKKLQELTKKNPSVTRALELRQKYQQEIAEELVKYGIMPKQILESQDYFHHQVLKYFNEKQQSIATGGSKELRNKWRGWMSGRISNAEEYNTEYLEAEFMVLAQQIAQVETAKNLQEIEKTNNIMKRLKAEAKRANEDAVYKIYDDLAKQGLVPADPITGKAEDPFKDFSKKIAMGFSHLKQAVKSKDFVYDQEYHDIVQQIKQAAKDKMPINHPRLFEFLSHQIESKGDASMAAAMIYKGIKDKEKFIRETLGDKFKTYKSMIPEGYIEWKPTPNNAWFWTNSIGDQVLQDVLTGTKSLEDKDVRKVLARGKDVIWVIPQGLAAQMDKLRPVTEHTMLEKTSANILAAWKQWILINPLSVLKYNINNTTGDLDAVFAYNPKIANPIAIKTALLDLKRWAEYQDVDANLAAELEEAQKMGVVGSGFSVQEVEDVMKMMSHDAVVREVILGEKPNLVAKLWQQSKKWTSIREDTLRLAAFRYFKNEIANKGTRKIYGASNPKDIDNLISRKQYTEASAKLARELLGDYGNISRTGEYIRRRMVPFYSWVEINLPRYAYMMRNLKEEGGSVKGLSFVMAKRSAVFAAKASMFYGAVMLWNALAHPDEDDDMGESGRKQLHLILGRNDDGSISSIRFQGAFSDALSWFGAEDLPHDIADLVKGKATIQDKLFDIPKSITNKLVNSLRPEPKLLYESITGESAYPNVFAPRPIRDKIENVLSTFKLDIPYRTALGRPGHGDTVAKHLWHDLKGIITYTTEPGVQAYYDTKKLVMDWKKKNGLETGGGKPTNRGNALYYYKQAMKYGDLPAAKRYLTKYYELGGTRQGLKQSIKLANPLSGIRKQDRYAFRQSLSPAEVERMKKGIEWYKKTYL